MDKMPMVLHPADRTVFTADAVFRVVRVVLIYGNLFADGIFHRIQILGINKPFKRISGKLPELFQSAALKHTQDALICVDNLLITTGIVDEKTTGDFVQEADAAKGSQNILCGMCRHVLYSPQMSAQKNSLPG